MKKLLLFVFVLFVASVANAQITTDSIQKKEVVTDENDTIVKDPILLEEVVVYKNKLTPEEKKEFLLLQNRVYKVYPFAKAAADRLTILNRNMDKMKTNKEKKKYFKIVEDYMENEFTAQLKKLSRKQGQILVKLIHRQTGYTTFELIKDYKSGWKAFWSSNTAKLFNIDLKKSYEPMQVPEDFYIESYLIRAFDEGKLLKQEAKTPISESELRLNWAAKNRQKAKL